jgi:thioredoxin-dependent peroxiredoxin
MQDYFEPKVGDAAPRFRLPSTEGKPISMTDFKGKSIVLYFYPKDNTPGCTAEACSFRDRAKELQDEGAVVLGVSTDSLESHDSFRSKHQLNFPLLSDETSDVAKMYGVWKEKNLYGRRSWGVARTTYLIGPDGRVNKVYKKVDTKNHGDEVLRDLRELKQKKK